jgi:hypothetical protein
VEAARNSPILWYDERYVDFGSFQKAANNRLREPSVTFEFKLRLPIYFDGVLGWPVDFAMTLAGGDVPYVSAYEIRVAGHELRWDFDATGRARGLSVDDKSRLLANTPHLDGECYLLPSFGLGEPSDPYFGPTWRPMANYPLLRVVDNPPTGHLFGDVLIFSRFLVDEADADLAFLARRIAYLGPLRASAQRAYRIQNLAVDEVDPNGSNLAMFLRSLSPEENQSFAAFTRDALDFETMVKKNDLHVEILVKRANETSSWVNLVDVGFGYSEVLPLAAALWTSCIRWPGDAQEPRLIAIEQPELHLHPAHQARLARMFVEAVSRNNNSKIIIETHSESLINGLGKLVYEGAIKAEDVQIVLFDQDEETEETTVRLAGYRENGALRDWPYGFLSPVAERRTPLAAAE